MKVAMIFPGFGSQYVGMCKELYDEHRIIQEYFEQASSCLDINFVKLCFASSDVELALLRHAYTSIFLVSASIAGLLKSEGILCDVVAGYHQGEYAALFAADGIGLADGLYLLNKHALFYQELLQTSAMVALSITGLDAQEVEKICHKADAYHESKVFVASYDSATKHIIAGESAAVDRVQAIIDDSKEDEKRSVKIVAADVGIGLHSMLMESVARQLTMYLEKVDFHDLSVPFIESTYGKMVRRGVQVREHIVSCITKPVVWSSVMEKLGGYDTIIAVGPGAVLSSVIHERYKEKVVCSINQPKDLHELTSLLSRKQSEQN